MLGKKENTDVKINTILGRDSDFQGDISIKGAARVDGNVDGNVKVSGTLIVGSTGRITGLVEVAAAVIGGEVLGDITASERVELTATAKVLGDVTTKIIVIDENAVFQGKCDMNQEMPDKKRGKASVKAARAGKKSARAAIEEALKEVAEAEKRETQNTENTTDNTSPEIKDSAEPAAPEHKTE